MSDEIAKVIRMVAQADEIIEKMQAMREEWTTPLLAGLKAYDAHLRDTKTGVRGGGVPCSVEVAGSVTPWKVAEITDEHVVFTHDCWEHGYDLNDTETVGVPIKFFTDLEELANAQEG